MQDVRDRLGVRRAWPNPAGRLWAVGTIFYVRCSFSQACLGHEARIRHVHAHARTHITLNVLGVVRVCARVLSQDRAGTSEPAVPLCGWGMEWGGWGGWGGGAMCWHPGDVQNTRAVSRPGRSDPFQRATTDVCSRGVWSSSWVGGAGGAGAASTQSTGPSGPSLPWVFGLAGTPRCPSMTR